MTGPFGFAPGSFFPGVRRLEVWQVWQVQQAKDAFRLFTLFRDHAAAQGRGSPSAWAGESRNRGVNSRCSKKVIVAWVTKVDTGSS